MAIIAKILLDDPVGEGRRLAAARALIERLRRDYGPLGVEKETFLQRQLAVITLREAARAFEQAETSRRAGFRHRAAAQYEAIIRDYPGTLHAESAREALEQRKLSPR